MNTPKEQVARQFLDLLSQHVPLTDARVVTLGGQGIEAKIWAESRIPPEHGSLIELNRELGSRLIERYRYRIHNRLGTFHQILAGEEGQTAQIDAFHLDLCGTITEQVLDDFAPLLPLILRSTGKCLAVTVADQRGTASLEQWSEIDERSVHLFGGHAAELLERIEATQEQLPKRANLPNFMRVFDPHKGAQREFGLLVELTELFRRHPAWAPVAITRYVYVSRYGGTPFRMRTFFFHFARLGPEASALGIARLWTESPLYLHQKPGAFIEITAPSTIVERPTQGELMSQTTDAKASPSRLGEMARVLGGAELAEYEELVRSHAAFQQIRAAIDSVSHQSLPPPPESAPRRLAAPARKKRYEDLTDAEKLEWQLKMAELRTGVYERERAAGRNQDACEDVWEKEWKKLIEQDFGSYTPELGRSLRSAMSRISGKFRPVFTRRVEKVLGADAPAYLERLAKIPA